MSGYHQGPAQLWNQRMKLFQTGMKTDQIFHEPPLPVSLDVLLLQGRFMFLVMDYLLSLRALIRSAGASEPKCLLYLSFIFPSLIWWIRKRLM